MGLVPSLEPNTTVFMLIIVRSMKLPTTKLCVVCLGGVIVVNYGNKHLFPKLCPPMAKFVNVVERTTN